MAGKGGSSQSDRREEAQGKDTFRRSRQGDTAGTTEELQQEMALKAAPSMIYLPVEFVRFPLALTLCDTSQFTVAQRPHSLLPKAK